MNFIISHRLIIRQYVWLLLLPLLAGCGTATPATAAAIATPTSLNMNALSTQIVGTFVAQVTQTAYHTPTETPQPTYTPHPTQTPRPMYALDGKLKASIIDGNLYVQNGAGENIQLTHNKDDHDPIFSDDSKKIVFYRGYGNNHLYTINANGGAEQQIIDAQALAVQDTTGIKALTFIKNTHILLFNIYVCGDGYLYKGAYCFVSAYSVDADSGKTEEIGQRVSGVGYNRGNFEISPNQKYLSIVGSGHVNIFSFSAGHFKLAYFGAFTYKMTRPDEFLPHQYWLPDSSGLIFVTVSDLYNEPGTAPKTYAAFRYKLGHVTTKIPLKKIITKGPDGYTAVSISPDRNWIIFAGNDTGDIFDKSSYCLGNLNTGQIQSEKLRLATLYSIQWNPDSKHFASTSTLNDLIGSVDGPSIQIGGMFMHWIDATHYSYVTMTNRDPKKAKYYIAEIGGDSVLVLTPTPTPSTVYRPPS